MAHLDGRISPRFRWCLRLHALRGHGARRGQRRGARLGSPGRRQSQGGPGSSRASAAIWVRSTRPARSVARAWPRALPAPDPRAIRSSRLRSMGRQRPLLRLARECSRRRGLHSVPRGGGALDRAAPLEMECRRRGHERDGRSALGTGGPCVRFDDVLGTDAPVARNRLEGGDVAPRSRRTFRCAPCKAPEP